MRCLFGEVINGQMVLNAAGVMIHEQWLLLQQRFRPIHLHECIVMPNHFHGIIEIIPDPNAVRAPLVGALAPAATDTATDAINSIPDPANMIDPKPGQPRGIAPTVGAMMDAFKSIVTVEYIRGVKSNHWQPFYKKLWHRNYWEHVIRSQLEYDRIRNYIQHNPAKWTGDTFCSGGISIVCEPVARYATEPWMVCC